HFAVDSGGCTLSVTHDAGIGCKGCGVLLGATGHVSASLAPVEKYVPFSTMYCCSLSPSSVNRAFTSASAVASRCSAMKMGMTIAASTAIRATTTDSSTRVNPPSRFTRHLHCSSCAMACQFTSDEQTAGSPRETPPLTERDRRHFSSSGAEKCHQ